MTWLTYIEFVTLVLQLAGLVILYRIFASPQIREMRQFLKEQGNQHTSAIQQSVREGTDAAKAAYEEANTVNVKISDLNKRLLEREKRK